MVFIFFTDKVYFLDFIHVIKRTFRWKTDPLLSYIQFGAAGRQPIEVDAAVADCHMSI